MNNIALLILRVVFAGSLLYGHGLGKLNRLIEGDLSFSNPIGIGEAPTFILAVFSEFLAPIFIIVGYKTKFFSFFPAATMFVAAFIVHMAGGDPFGRVEKPLLFLVGFIVIMMIIPFEYSLIVMMNNCFSFVSRGGRGATERVRRYQAIARGSRPVGSNSVTRSRS